MLVDATHETVADIFGDGKNYAHYFARPSLMYRFLFVNGLCMANGHTEGSATFMVLYRVFRACGLGESEAKAGVETAMDLVSMGAKHKSKLFSLVARIAAIDAQYFDWERLADLHADHFAMIVSLGERKA